MKRLVMVVIVALVGLTTNAQNIDLDIDPKVDIDLKDLDVKVDVKIKEAFDFDIKVDTRFMEKIESKIKFNFDPDLDINVDGNWNEEDMSRYQQTEQEMEIPLSKPGEPGKLIVESHNGRISISGYDGNSVKVKMVKYGKKVERDRESKDGMKLVSSGGMNVEASEYNNTVEVEKEGWGDRVDFVIQVPRNFDIEAETYNNGHIWIEDIQGEVNVESYNGPITLSKISGSASASTYNGAIEVDFNSVTADSPMVFSTYNGNVDLTVPGGTKLTAKMKTNRDIYTDFDSFSLNESKPETRAGRNGRGYSVKYENWVEGNLNGGGPDVTMKTTNGNIYIRKGN